jgi:GT2 family glycosyltransferase
MDVFWFPNTIPYIHEIPFACSCCLAVEKKVFWKIGKFDSGLTFWGEEDSELCMRAWLLGYRVMCDPSIIVGHMFKKSHSYSIELSDMIYNKIRFAFSHFSKERMSRQFKFLSEMNHFTTILIHVLENGVLERRFDLLKKRIHDDNWFFEKFPMDGWN